MNNQNQYGLVDLEYLREISGNDADFIKEMLDMFLAQTPELMSDLSNAIQQSDYQNIKSNAHKVKPTYAMVGREDFKQAMQQIENLSKENASITEIQQVYNLVAGVLDILYKDIELAKSHL